MHFFPTREYIVTTRDTIMFQLPPSRLSAPHIVTFLNGKICSNLYNDGICVSMTYHLKNLKSL
jgi:hypothetical protein